jgi:rubrerythrin
MIVMSSKKTKDIADFLYCCGNLEEKVFALYRTLSDKVQNPIVKSLFLYIAYDSLKHSMTMRGIAETISESKPKPEDCARKINQVWRKIASLSTDISNSEKIGDHELSPLASELAGFENLLCEEYFVLVQVKTLEYMTKEIAQMYKVDLDGLKNIFELIIKDEENHRGILNSIEELFVAEQIMKDNTPVVKYQHPEAW